MHEILSYHEYLNAANPVLRELCMWLPFFLWWGLFAWLRWCSPPEIRAKFNGTLNSWMSGAGGWRWAKRHFIPLLFFLSLLWRLLFAIGYTYEAQIYIEALLPGIFAIPFLRKLFTRFRLLALCIMPICFLVIVEQIKAVQFEQWTYCFSCDYKFLVWGRQAGNLLERSLYFGVDMPMIEILFYPAYLLLTVAVAAIAIESFPNNWLHPKNNGLKLFFPLVFGIPTAVLTGGLVWFFIQNGGRTIPYHTIAALAPLVLSWTGVIFSEQIRKLVRTPLFVFGTVFSIFWTAIWEWMHASLEWHWIYLTQNSLGSLHPILDTRFPDWPLVGGAPLPWPVEEWCAYPTLYVFMAAYVVFFHHVLKVPLLRHPIVNVTRSG